MYMSGVRNTMESRFDAVLFDFDGTFADTGVGIFNSIRFAVAAMGLPPINEKKLRTFIGPPIKDSFKRELGLTEEQCDFAVTKYRETYGKRGIFQFEVYDGINELIDTLRDSGIKVAIASAKPEIYIKRIFAFIGIEDKIDYISAITNEKEQCDKCTLIKNAIEALGVDKSRVLMVGDRHFDINGANAAGVRSVGVTYGYGTREELKNAGANYVVDAAKDIAEVIFS